MNTRITAALASAVLLAPGIAAATNYEIDPGHTSAAFSVRHMMVTKVRGTFGKVSGNVNLDDKDLTKSQVNATIDATSIDTGNEDRDKHLKSPDFFDVAKHPTLTFKSRKVSKAGSGYSVDGDLTIKGVTKPVTLTVDEVTNEVKDPWGNMKRGASAKTKINRKEFGLNWNKSLETGGVLVGDEVDITLDVELLSKAPAPAPNPAAAKTDGTKTEAKK